MKTSKLRFNESGIAHLGLIVLVVVIVAAGFFAFSRVKTAEDSSNNQESGQVSADNTTDDADLEKATQEAQASDTGTTEQEDGQDAAL